MTERTGHHRVRRFALRVAAFLLLGAIVNVAVAWGFGILYYDGSRVDCFIEAEGERPSELAHVSVCIANPWPATRIDCFKDFDPKGNFQRVADLTNEIPYWARRHLNQRELKAHDERYYAVYASGWPLRALSGQLRLAGMSSGYTLSPSALIVLPPPPLLRNDQSRLIPLLPIWPGFAINTLFYATILWLLFAGLGTVRRWRRCKRGLCPKCAYPQGTSEVCTECGEKIHRRGAEVAEG